MNYQEDEDVEEFDEEETGESEYALPSSEIQFEVRETKPWESKLGGCPYLHTKEEYPIGKNKKPMLFIAQINLKELPKMPMLPDHGLLQFFVNQDDLFGVYEDPLVRWIEEVTESEDGLLSEHPFADEEYEKLLPFEQSAKMNFSKIEMSEDEEETCRVGGYPYFPQDGEFEPDENFLLLQLADEGVCDICFGDCGVALFIIDLDDLENRNFSNVFYESQSC